MDPVPLPDTLRPLLQQLDEALSLEGKFQAHLLLPSTLQDSQEVTFGIRDGSANVLRCLKVWYDLPSDVLFVAVNLMDRFLTKMKVRPKHMACISIAAFQLASHMVCGGAGPGATDVCAISQCKCTLGDLNRMQAVISSKLSAENESSPITALVFLRIFHGLLTAIDVDGIYARAVGEHDMLLRLEVLACDAGCSNFRACEVALVLLCSQLDSGVAALKPAPPASGVIALISFVANLQQHCKISERAFYSCHLAVLNILARYNAELQLPHRQRLVWKLSQRTLRSLRPTERLVTTLPTIDEHGQLHITPGCRRSGSFSSSDESWSGMSWASGQE